MEEYSHLPMSLITIIWSMSASACLTLAEINLVVWCRDRKAWANLLFSLTATFTAAWTFCELWMMRADTPREFAYVLRWGHVAVCLLVVSLVVFTRLFLGAGRAWLAWLVCGLRAFLLFPNFLGGQNLNFREVTRLGHMKLFGESVTIGEGVPNPWILLGQVSLVILIIYLADATITAWQRGNRHHALTVGASVVFFVLVATGQSLLVFYGIIRVPYVGSVFFIGLIIVMGYELGSEMLRAARLDRKLQVSEAGLHEIEERMRLAVEAADFGIWARDLVNDEVWATDKWRALFGFSETERLQYGHILERVHPGDRDAVSLIMKNTAEGHGSGALEHRLILPNNQVRWISSLGRAVFDASGRAILIRGISQDITERKRAEEETQNLRREIAHVGRISMMGQLASALAHEINQPLGAILRNAEAAELFLHNASPDLDEIRAILADIRRDDQRAVDVIDRMRRLLKRQSLDKRPVDMGKLIGGVVGLLRSDAAARQVKLQVAVADDLPPALGDPVHLQQVLMNLIVNGMDALDDVNGEERRISVSASAAGAKAVEVAVSDSGRGVPADKLTDIFDPFFTTKPKGMGMGLCISRTIIEAHHGRLWAENPKEGGAAFRFTLPIEEKDASP